MSLTFDRVAFLSRLIFTPPLCTSPIGPDAMMLDTASKTIRSLLMLTAIGLSTNVATADDWPQWMGPTRDGNYNETGLVESIPTDGLPIKWRVPVDGGYAGPAVVGDRIYVMDYQRTKGTLVEDPGTKPKLEGIERLRCLDATNGDQIWKYEYPCSYRISYPAGPRATPTVVDGVVAILGAQGDLAVLDAESGNVKWHINLPEQFNAPVPTWGFAAHPLVTDDMVVTMVGGTDQAVVAFDRNTGKVKWKSLSSTDAGYCPPSIIQAGGTTQLIAWHPHAIASLNPKTGETYWTVPLIPDYGMSISQPQHSGEYLFASGIKDKSLMLKLDADKPAVTEVWAGAPKMSLSVSTMTPVIHDGLMFGTDESLGALVAAKVADGERVWQTYEPVRPEQKRKLPAGTVFVTRHTASGHYFLFGEDGHFSIADMDADGYHSRGQMKVVEPTQTAFGRKVVWSHPAYANQTAYVRNDKELVAIDLAKP
ncbi:Pyrrolo-quinoline quinone [Rhodopirellula maiorica SM1]|uniref:Pyrrolo-quinoline quinone n=2 Tax=Novipirellula TaxID=2795426 RepID=M5RAF6_9BACT|nr:Pyrrolo-quinoline quinone [Rhodopirellula maiorica SM1]